MPPTPKKNKKEETPKKPAVRAKKAPKAAAAVEEQKKTHTPKTEPEIVELLVGETPEKGEEDVIEGVEGDSERYWEAVGRRKTAVARVRLYTRGDKEIVVNGKAFHVYFQFPSYHEIIEEPLKKMKSGDRFRVSAKISGGGPHAQAEALRHGISRALVKFNPDFRKRLKRAGYLKRDPRMKERKKFGLKGARRSPQWQKR